MNIDAAVLRAKNYAAPITMMIFKQDYSSFDELSKVAEGACSQLVITGMSITKGRIKGNIKSNINKLYKMLV